MKEMKEQGCCSDHEDGGHYHDDEGEFHKLVSREVDISHPSQQRVEKIGHGLTNQVDKGAIFIASVIQNYIRAYHRHVYQDTAKNDQVS